MASQVINGAVDSQCQVYGDSVITPSALVKTYLEVGSGSAAQVTTVNQVTVPESILGIPIQKLVGQIETGLVNCDGLTIQTNAFVAQCIGRGVFGVGSVGVDTVTTAASDQFAYVFVAPQVEYSGAVPPAVVYVAATGVLSVTAKTATSFTVTSSLGAADEGKGYIWWIVNPSYA